MNVGMRRFICVKMISKVRNSILKRGFLTHQTVANKYEYDSLITCLAFRDRKNLVKFTDVSSSSLIKDSLVRNAVIDPVPITKQEINIPTNVIIRNFELPTPSNNELFDPVGNVEEKKAINMIKTRKKKMKKHKWKKLQKKMRFIFSKVRKKRAIRKDKIFKEEVQKILAEGLEYNAEQELNEKLKILQWEKPLTHIRGRFCPKWVVDEYLEKEREEKKIDERIAFCLKKIKL